MTLQMIVHGTPVWVWLLLAYLVSRGVKAMKGGTTPLSKLAIIPLIFAGFGLVHLAHNPHASLFAVSAWIVGIFAGIAAGVFNATRTRFSVDMVARTVTLPGSVVPLLLILAIFAAKFWLGFEMATVMDKALLGTYASIGALVSGVVAGMFAGRFITYWKALQAHRFLHA